MAGRHILLLTDRDWTHPQGGGTGTNLYGQVSRWVAWGHTVTVIAGSYPGAPAFEQLAPNLSIHRMGNRLTVFPLAAWAVRRRGVGRDADVALELVNGITFLSPLWLRMPRVTFIQHIHRDHYVAELGRRGSVAAFLLETLPLRTLYASSPFLTISEAGRRNLAALGIDDEQITVSHLGVERPVFPRSPRADRPRLLYLGRLKQYKRIELLLDVLDATGDAHLDIAGDGDHRPALEAEIAARGLTDRVTLHGHVSEEFKAELLSRSWVNLTASSAEGWCLTVMEAATYGTPSAALRVGGLEESIVDGRTGLLARDPVELAAVVGDLIADPARCEELGAAADVRAREFTWERTATEGIAVLESALVEERVSVRQRLSASEMMKVVALAGATLAANAFAVLFTVLFARLLGADGYGSLAALVSTFLILAVPGSALQIAVAREVALGRLGAGAELAATIRAWRRQLVVGTLALTLGAVLLRDQLAALLAVDTPWAAAATIPTGALWLLLSLERGALQGARGYRAVGLSIVLEAAGRLLFGVILFAVGMGVTGVYLGTPLSMIAAAGALIVVSHRQLGPAAAGPASTRLRDLANGAWPAISALFLVAVLQNVDVILVKRQIGGDEAGAYAAAAVAAKAIIWVAVGIALYLLPEAARMANDGGDPRRVLGRSLGVIAALAVPVLLVYALVPGLVLRLAFGPEAEIASSVLPVLGVAMTLLAAAYLGVQYMLALRRRGFLVALGAAAAAEVVLLSAGGFDDLTTFAAYVLLLQAAMTVSVLALGFTTRQAASA